MHSFSQDTNQDHVVRMPNIRNSTTSTLHDDSDARISHQKSRSESLLDGGSAPPTNRSEGSQSRSHSDSSSGEDPSPSPSSNRTKQYVNGGPIWIPRIVSWTVSMFMVMFVVYILLILGGLLILSFTLSSGLIDRGGILLWIIISYIIVEIVFLAIFFLFPSNRNGKSCKRRGKCMALEALVYFFSIQCILIAVLPSSFLFAGYKGALGETNVLIFSERGLEIQRDSNCDYEAFLEEATNFFGCSVNFDLLNIYYGGVPSVYRSLSSVVIDNNLFVQHGACIEPKIFIFSIAQVWQVQHNMWYGPSAPSQFFSRFGRLFTDDDESDYGGLDQLQLARSLNKTIFDFSLPQQAQIVTDYWSELKANLISSNSTNLALLKTFASTVLEMC
eukprot:TRINITY_DN2989_c0_g1_i1.p1 TRINITY_DN2989_c0_g1~~TRINITY_DN2989_c0_g1_i1.p1  ORF type:complete len:388 (+),score=25.70 TRINITY_DN2989_c0_g1_i1:147-1310(+)